MIQNIKNLIQRSFNIELHLNVTKESFMTLLTEEIQITGLSIVTTNHNNQGMQDIGKLWQEFSKHPLFSKLMAKGTKVYSVYDEYESDETGGYRVTIGCKNLEAVEGFSAVKIQTGHYKEFKVSPISPENIGDTWQNIWKDQSLKRTFSTDYEVYERDKMSIYVKVNP